jgi:hypothetical protein
MRYNMGRKPKATDYVSNARLRELIIEYNDIHICVGTHIFEIHIWGENLSADDYGGGGITVKGIIKSVELEYLRL